MAKQSKKIVISRDVIFNENDHIKSSIYINEDHEDLIDPTLFRQLPTTPKNPQAIPQQVQPTPTQSLSNQNFHRDHLQSDSSPPSYNNMLETFSNLSLDQNRIDLPHDDEEVTSTVREPPPPAGSSRPKRIIKPSTRLLESIQSTSSPKRGCSYHKSRHYANMAKTTNISLEPPQTITEALARPDAHYWQAAIDVELQSLEKNKTWKLTSLPPNRKPISSKWVFKIKTHANGTIDKYKARLVAHGFTQVQGIDYSETFSPVVKLNSIKVLLALATQYNLEIHQLDVKTAFLHGYIDEDIYLSLPEGLFAPSNMVCKLIKSLYGLKQSSRAWYMHFDTYLIQQGFSKLEAGANIYLKHDNDDGFTILTVYVDDCILISNHISLIHKIKALLHTTFEMTNEGEIHYILGNSIIRNRQEG